MRRLLPSQARGSRAPAQRGRPWEDLVPPGVLGHGAWHLTCPIWRDVSWWHAVQFLSGHWELDGATGRHPCRNWQRCRHGRKQP